LENCSIKVKLDQSIYNDPIKPHLCRMLFEGSFKKNQIEHTVYLYIWIKEKNILDSFQMVLDEKFTFTVKLPQNFSFGTIGSIPFNRSIKTNIEPKMLNKDNNNMDLIMLLCRIKNDQFSNLLNQISYVGKNKSTEGISGVLNVSERKYFCLLESCSNAKTDHANSSNSISPKTLALATIGLTIFPLCVLILIDLIFL
jgi:hypothetical protein